MSTQTPALEGLGNTLYGPTSTIDTSDYGSSVTLEGTKAVFDFVDFADKTKKDNRKVHAIYVRNTSGITLMGKLAVVWSTTAGERGRRIKGYCSSTAEEIAGVLDDRLGVTGVRNGDMCWVIVKGPALMLTPLAGDGTNVLTVDDILFAATVDTTGLTGVTTGGTTANEGGGFTIDDGTFSQTETTDGTARNEIRNAFGVAMSAATTANTKAARLIDVSVQRSPGG